MGLLAVDGTLVNLGALSGPFSVNAFALMSGSMIGGVAETQEMPYFSAERSIGADVEVIAADQVNAAYERVLASDVRNRFVIDASISA